MTKSKSSQEIIQNVFTPKVGVMCTSAAEQAVGKNNLTFVELLQPFATLNVDTSVRDPSGSLQQVNNIKFNIKDINWSPPSVNLLKHILNETVTSEYHDNVVQVQIGTKSIQVPSSTPWYDKWRDVYLANHTPVEHEYIDGFFSCLLVVSSREDVGPALANHVRNLANMQTVTNTTYPRFFNSNVLRTYILLHDASDGNLDKAERMFDSMKQTYGSGNCFMLVINSIVDAVQINTNLPDIWSEFIEKKTLSSNEIDPNLLQTSEETAEIVTSSVGSTSPHPLSPSSTFLNDVFVSSLNAEVSTQQLVHGICLSSGDRDVLKSFMLLYAVNAFLPYLERQIAQLTDAVANRKGVSRTLLSATKRWFGTNKPGTNPAASTVVLTSDCFELQQRRTGDAWAACGAWKQAFIAYHAAKRELGGAWCVYASTLAAASLTAYLASEHNRKTMDYIDESILTFMNTCRLTEAAVRMSILSACMLTGGEAARHLIRMTAEEADLRSALLLEQAALCFAVPQGSLPRKYAFHMVLAGHRYSKAGQKHHAYRCYSNAYQSYTGSGWRLAEEHVCASLGRLALTLQRAESASIHLSQALTPNSPHPQRHHRALLREYLLALQQQENSRSNTSIQELPLPILLSQETVVWCCGPSPVTTPKRSPATRLIEDAKLMAKLEEMSLQAANIPNALMLKPTITRFNNHTDNTIQPKVPQGEPIQIIIEMENPIKVDLILTNIQLLWTFTPKNMESSSNEEYLTSNRQQPTDNVASPAIKLVSLMAEESSQITFTLTPLKSGDLNITGVCYRLHYSPENGEDTELSVFGKQLFNIKGPRLNKNKDFPKDQYAVDKRLQIHVTECAPCLQMTVSETSDTAYSGEMRIVDVDLVNVGPVALRDLYLAVSSPNEMVIASDRAPFTELYDEMYRPEPLFEEERVRRAFHRMRAVKRHTSLQTNSISPGGHIGLRLLLSPQAVVEIETTPQTSLALLACYFHPNINQHRILAHQFNIRAQDVVSLKCTSKRSMKLNEATNKCTEVLNISLEIKNISKQESQVEVRVLHVALLSKKWHLRELLPNYGAELNLKSLEKMHLVLNADRIPINSLNEEEICHSGLVVNSTCSEANDPITSEPYSRFVTQFPSLWEETEQRSVNTSDAMLVVRWLAGDQLKRGISRVRVNVKTVPEIVCRIAPTKQFVHDFNVRSLYVVPLKLHILNCSERELNAQIQTVDKNGLRIVGACNGRTICLAGGESVCVNVNACVCTTGSCDVRGALRVCVDNETYSPPALISVCAPA